MQNHPYLSCSTVQSTTLNNKLKNICPAQTDGSLDEHVVPPNDQWLYQQLHVPCRVLAKYSAYPRQI